MAANKDKAATREVIIIGGGVAGLTAAHELQERGFVVTVYERNEDPEHPSKVILGGKARSFPITAKFAYGWNSSEDGNKIIGLPGEHGFRFFPGFYQHIIDTMRRIPIGRGKYVSDNLKAIEHAAYAREGRPFFRFGTSQPETLRQFWKSLRRLFLQNPGLGLSPMEAAFAASKLVNAMTMCDERREAELETVPWSEYMSARDMSDAYRAVIVNGLSQNFVAMDARLLSTKTAITTLARLLNDLTTPGRSADRILNGPTSEAWITHWKSHLSQESPSEIHHEPDWSGTTKVTFKKGKIECLKFDPATNRIVGAMAEGQPIGSPDCQYILAVPAEGAADILDRTAAVTPQIFSHSPSLKSIKDLSVSWMVGLIFYLKADVEMCPGHIVYLNSPWAIISISQNQFWDTKMDSRSETAKSIRRFEMEKELKRSRANLEKLNANKTGTGSKDSGQWDDAIKQLEEHIRKLEAVYSENESISINGIISVNLSDWDKPGRRNRHRTAREAEDVLEVAQEAMAQIRVHLTGLREKDAPNNQNLLKAFEDGNIVGYTLDPAIIFHTRVQSAFDATKAKRPDESKSFQDNSHFRSALGTISPRAEAKAGANIASAGAAPDNLEPLFINTAGSASLRPTAVTGIENLFLASDYVKTNSDLATMEAANEAARRAVNGILDSMGAKRARCQIFKFDEPAVLAPFKAVDKGLFELGLPHPSFLLDPLLFFGAKLSETARRWARE